MRQGNAEREAGAAETSDDAADGTAAPVRRAPYSDNPTVGARGLRTQQRILDAALQVFGEHGYERSTLDRIGQVAGCSRVSIYQYFSGKDDVFRHLAGQTARQLRASAEALEPLTDDTAGWTALRAWVARYADVHARHEAVFRAFGTATQADASLAGGSARVAERNLAVFQSKLTTTPLPPRQLEPVVAVLLASVTRTLDIASILRSALPDAYPRDRVADAVADVLHRALFGLRPEVNAQLPVGDRAPTLRIGQAFDELLQRTDALEAESRQPSRRALASLLEVGQDVIVGRGYQGTRVDDVVDAAGVSHGAFYRYFENKDELVQVIAMRALRAVSTALAEIPDVRDRVALRRWLRRYNAVHAEKAAMIRVWAEAVDDPMRSDRAAAFDWGRRQMARVLRGRAFGDDDVEAVALLAVIEAFGSQPRGSAEVDAAIHVVQRGFLGFV
jgi:AcrR family transcriptional regulator